MEVKRGLESLGLVSVGPLRSLGVGVPVVFLSFLFFFLPFFSFFLFCLFIYIPLCGNSFCSLFVAKILS